MWNLLLTFTFVNQLKEAYSQGLFKSYKRFDYNDSRVKGIIDVNRHIKENIPFMGNIAYSVREHTYDNHILHLIRHAFELLEKKHSTLMKILKSNTSGVRLSKIKNDLLEVTPSYNSMNIQNTLIKTSNRISHPYFNKYELLRKTCRMILKDSGISIYNNNSKEEVYGVMVDVTKLWEEFAGKEILSKLDFQHVRGETPLLVESSTIKENTLNVVKKREFDYVCKGKMVVDAKYKLIWQNLSWKYLSADIFQVLSYILVAGVKKGGVIFPSLGKNPIDEYNIHTDHTEDPYSQGYNFYTIPLEIPREKNDSIQFKNDMEKNIENLIENLDGIINHRN